LLPTRAWVFHAQWQDRVTTHSHPIKVWVARVNQVAVQVDLVQLVPVVLHLDRVDLVQLEQEDRQEQPHLVQLVLVLQAELQVSVVLVVDQVLVAAVAVVAQLVHSVRVDLETLLRLESQRERNAKNSNYVQHLASVERLSHAVTVTLSFVYVAVHRFKTSQTRLMPMQVS
jgi:hypothetical protein